MYFNIRTISICSPAHLIYVDSTKCYNYLGLLCVCVCHGRSIERAGSVFGQLVHELTHELANEEQLWNATISE